MSNACNSLSRVNQFQSHIPNHHSLMGRQNTGVLNTPVF